MRRVERALPDEYLALVEAAVARGPETALAVAELPDMVRGYEDIKLANVGASAPAPPSCSPEWEQRPTKVVGVLTAKGQATKARIVATAADLVFKQGVAGTSIEDVRKAAGVSGSQMTHYFDDKQSLIRAVVTHQADAVLASHEALGNLDGFAALDAWANLQIEQQRRRHCAGGCALGSVTAEVVECDAEARANAERGFERWEALLRDGLTAMRDRGDLRPEADPAELALALLAAVQGGALLTQARRDTAPLEAALNIALAHVRSLAA